MEKDMILKCCIGIVIVALIIVGIGMLTNSNTKETTTHDFGGFKVNLSAKADTHVEHINNTYDNTTVVSSVYDNSGNKDVTIEYYEYADKTPPYTTTNHELDYDKSLDEWYAVIFDTDNHRCVKISCHDDNLLREVCKSFEFQ